GVALYFEDSQRAKKFYLDTLGLHLSDEQPGHHAKFAADAAFVCLETKGSESYPSRDKARPYRGRDRTPNLWFPNRRTQRQQRTWHGARAARPRGGGPVCRGKTSWRAASLQNTALHP